VDPKQLRPHRPICRPPHLWRQVLAGARLPPPLPLRCSHRHPRRRVQAAPPRYPCRCRCPHGSECLKPLEVLA
jgi:hypothetical protein